MERFTELDQAQIKHEMRELYRYLGYKGTIEWLYNVIVGIKLTIEVIKEEYAKENE